MFMNYISKKTLIQNNLTLDFTNDISESNDLNTNMVVYIKILKN